MVPILLAAVFSGPACVDCDLEDLRGLCPPGSTPYLTSEASAGCAGAIEGEYTVLTSGGSAEGACTARGQCEVFCKLDQPCRCGIARKFSATEVSCTACTECGDGRKEGQEECDDGPRNGQPESLCSSVCTTIRCGNGVQERDEECDGGDDNGKPGSLCSAVCDKIVCSNEVHCLTQQTLRSCSPEGVPLDVECGPGHHCRDGSPASCVACECSLGQAECVGTRELRECASPCTFAAPRACAGTETCQADPTRGARCAEPQPSCTRTPPASCVDWDPVGCACLRTRCEFSLAGVSTPAASPTLPQPSTRAFECDGLTPGRAVEVRADDVTVGCVSPSLSCGAAERPEYAFALRMYVDLDDDGAQDDGETLVEKSVLGVCSTPGLAYPWATGALSSSVRPAGDRVAIRFLDQQAVYHLGNGVHSCALELKSGTLSIEQ